MTNCHAPSSKLEVDGVGVGFAASSLGNASDKDSRASTGSASANIFPAGSFDTASMTSCWAVDVAPVNATVGLLEVSCSHHKLKSARRRHAPGATVRWTRAACTSDTRARKSKSFVTSGHRRGRSRGHLGTPE